MVTDDPDNRHVVGEEHGENAGVENILMPTETMHMEVVSVKPPKTVIRPSLPS